VFKLRNLLFWALVVFACSGAVYAYLAIKKSKRPQVNALDTLPDSCIVYLNTSNFQGLNKRIRSQSLIADKLRLFGDIELLCSRLRLFDSLLFANEDLNDEIAESQIHLALYGSTPHWLSTFNIRQLGNQETVSESFGKLLNAKSEDQQIFSFSIDKDLRLFYCLNAGVVSLSDSRKLLEKARSSNGSKFTGSAAYKAFKVSLAEDGLLNVFVNHELYAANKACSKLNLGSFCGKGFSAGQIELEPSGLKINGFTSVDSSEIISILSHQHGQVTKELLPVLPANLVELKAYGFDAYSHVLSKLKPATNKDFWQEVNATAMYNLQAEFATNGGHHLVCFKTAVGQRFVALEVMDTLKAKEQLVLMSDTLQTEQGLKIARLRKTNSGEGLHLFAPLFSEQKTSYAAIYGSFLVFSDNPGDLRNLIVNMSSGAVATSNESFNYYRSQHFPDEYNYLAYYAPNACRDDIAAFFRFKATAGNDPFANLRHFSFSLVNDEKAFRFRLQLLNEAESNAREQNVLWTQNLDTISHMRPAGFVNHITGENEIAVQDEANKLYLISAKGSVLWKKNIGEKIISDIYAVDAFKNNKFQLLFNTRNYIHLIDRNGNPVKGFPIALPAEATSKMCLLDYDGDKDYRIFIACADHSIYNYNVHGQAQDGFVPVKTDHEVTLPVQYSRIGASDYLVALDKEGRIYTFGRKGQGRIGLKNRTLANCQAFFVDATNGLNTSNIFCVDDKSGLINKISFTDKKELVKLNMDPGSADINFSLVDDNREMDVVITHNNTIQSFNFNGDLLFEKSLDMDLAITGYYSDESHAFYYSLNKEKTELVICDQATQKIKKIKAAAMPLVSNLFGDNKKYLVVTNGKQLSCVPLN
jgi:hypothetical protein